MGKLEVEHTPRSRCFSAGSVGSYRRIRCSPAFWSWWYLQYTHTHPPSQKKKHWLNGILRFWLKAIMIHFHIQKFVLTAQTPSQRLQSHAKPLTKPRVKPQQKFWLYIKSTWCRRALVWLCRAHQLNELFINHFKVHRNTGPGWRTGRQRWMAHDSAATGKHREVSTHIPPLLQTKVLEIILKMACADGPLRGSQKKLILHVFFLQMSNKRRFQAFSHHRKNKLNRSRACLIP